MTPVTGGAVRPVGGYLFADYNFGANELAYAEVCKLDPDGLLNPGKWV